MNKYDWMLVLALLILLVALVFQGMNTTPFQPGDSASYWAKVAAIFTGVGALSTMALTLFGAYTLQDIRTNRRREYNERKLALLPVVVMGGSHAILTIVNVGSRPLVVLSVEMCWSKSSKFRKIDRDLEVYARDNQQNYGNRVIQSGRQEFICPADRDQLNFSSGPQDDDFEVFIRITFFDNENASGILKKIIKLENRQHLENKPTMKIADESR